MLSLKLFRIYEGIAGSTENNFNHYTKINLSRAQRRNKASIWKSGHAMNILSWIVSNDHNL